MYVCVCKAITEQQLRQFVHAGHDSLSHVEIVCGAGSDCGSCKFKVQKVIAEQRLCGNDKDQSSKAG